jgi:DNA modification methylase
MKNNIVINVSTSTLIPNEKKLSIYRTPHNYDEIKSNIEKQGIIEPLLVNKKTKVIISGNLRHQIAIELGIKEVPVIYEEMDDAEMGIKSISTNQQRVKSYSEILREIEFFEEHYKVKKGQRTDLDPEFKKLKEDRDSLLKTYTRPTREKVKAIASMAGALYGRESKEFDGIFDSLDNQKTTLNGLYQHLLDVTRRKQNALVIPEKYELIKENVKIYNKSSEDMDPIENESIHSIITSPPYRLMRDYGNGEDELGQEEAIEDYISKLMNIFRECYRVLRNDGSLFVNINDCVLGGQYQAVPHFFVIHMIQQGWILNDEILWIKHNPVYTKGKRSVRSHEPIFHFVKSPDFYYNDAWLKDLNDKEDKISYGINKSSPKVKSGMDFRDGVLTTNVANTSELRKECKEEGFHLTHSATFPLDVPAICGLLTTKEGDTILDPFAGTSTVGEFAIAQNRHFVGFELNPEFVMASEVRLEAGGHLLYLDPYWYSVLHEFRLGDEFSYRYREPISVDFKKSFTKFGKTFNKCLRVAQKNL